MEVSYYGNSEHGGVCLNGNRHPKDLDNQYRLLNEPLDNNTYVGCAQGSTGLGEDTSSRVADTQTEWGWY